MTVLPEGLRVVGALVVAVGFFVVVDGALVVREPEPEPEPEPDAEPESPEPKTSPLPGPDSPPELSGGGP